MTPRESRIDRMTRTVSGGRALHDAVSAARTFGDQLSLSDEERSRLCVIVEELVANLYDHGGVTGEQVVTLELVHEPDGIRMTLVDPGKPFDPRTAPPHPPVPGKGAGAGIDLVRAWSLIVDYRAEPEGNRLELMIPFAIRR